MKKVSTLLLTGIMGTSMLFAGISGTATLTGTIADLDAQTFGMANGLELDSADVQLYAETAEAMGEGEIYAEIAASLTVDIDDASEADHDTNTWALSNVNLALDYARVVGDGWSVDITGVAGPVDYAADTIALDEDDDAYNYSVAGETAAGVAVTLDDLGTVSVGVENGDFTALGNTEVYAALELAEVELSEGVTAQVAGSLSYEGALELGASAKFDYASDDMSLSFAADLGKDATGYGYDFVACATVADVTVDAYFGDANTNADFTFAETDVDAATTKLLNVKAATTVEDIALSLQGVDLLTEQNIDASVSVPVSEELTLAVSAGYVISTTAYDAGVDVTYAVEDYTFEAGLDYAKGGVLGASASVESTTLVDGATLTLAWADGSDLTNGTLGKITASCEIAF